MCIRDRSYSNSTVLKLSGALKGSLVSLFLFSVYTKYRNYCCDHKHLCAVNVYTGYLPTNQISCVSSHIIRKVMSNCNTLQGRICN